MICFATKLVRPGLHVGPAYPEDVEAIHELLQQASGDCLPLSREELQLRLPEFEVARAPSGRVVGCAAIRGGDHEHAELRCVAVRPEWRGTGTGRLLVERAVRRALWAGQDLFCVSRKPRFFQSLGFSLLPSEAVPVRAEADIDGPCRCALILRRRTATGKAS